MGVRAESRASSGDGGRRGRIRPSSTGVAAAQQLISPRPVPEARVTGRTFRIDRPQPGSKSRCWSFRKARQRCGRRGRWSGSEETATETTTAQLCPFSRHVPGSTIRIGGSVEPIRRASTPSMGGRIPESSQFDVASNHKWPRELLVAVFAAWLLFKTVADIFGHKHARLSSPGLQLQSKERIGWGAAGAKREFVVLLAIFHLYAHSRGRTRIARLARLSGLEPRDPVQLGFGLVRRHSQLAPEAFGQRRQSRSPPGRSIRDHSRGRYEGRGHAVLAQPVA